MWALLFPSNFRTNISYKRHANVQHRKFAFGRSNLCCFLKYRKNKINKYKKSSFKLKK